MTIFKSRKFIWPLAIGLTLILSTSIALAEKKPPVPEKVAIVNGKIIPLSEFNSELGQMKQRFSQQGRQIPEAKLGEIKKDILENLIAQELLYQESQNKGIKVEEKAVADALSTLKQRFPNEEEFNKALSKMSLSLPVVQSKLKQSIAIKDLLDSQVTKNITISDTEIKKFYEDNPKYFMEPEQVKASHILIKAEPKADEPTKTAAKKKIKIVQQKLKSGGDFSALAKEFSEGPTGVKGGDLGYFERGKMVKSFDQTAFALEPGTVSDIVETPFGYHIIKVVDKKPEKKVTYVDTKDKLGQFMKEKKTGQEVQLYIEKLKSAAKIERFL